MTGLPDYDQWLGGLFPGELVILAARPGVGKTALASQIGFHIASKGKPVYFASLEMSHVELAQRIVCGLAGVDSRRFRIGDLSQRDIEALAEAGNVYSRAKLFIDDRPAMTVRDIGRAARRLRRDGLALIVVDYLQRVTPADRKPMRHEQVGAMSDGLKQLARELEVPVLCLCQLNRESEKDDRPRLSHLRESGSIEQDADVVWLVHRQTRGSAQGGGDDLQATLQVEKNRNSTTGALKLIWIPNQTRFVCGSTPEAAEQAARQQGNYEPAFN